MTLLAGRMGGVHPACAHIGLFANVAVLGQITGLKLSSFPLRFQLEPRLPARQLIDLWEKKEKQI